MGDVLEELSKVGIEVSSVDELVMSRTRYPAAIPVLLAALEAEPDVNKKEWLVRALSVPWAKPAAIDPLLREFRAIPLDSERGGELTRWAVGNALWVLWDDAHFDDMVELARDRQYGRAREMVVLGFGKSKVPDKATAFLLTLLDDPDVDGHAVSALAKLAQPAARGALQRATSHPKTWVRKEAKKGLAKLDRLLSGEGES